MPAIQIAQNLSFQVVEQSLADLLGLMLNHVKEFVKRSPQFLKKLTV